jgi:hypothetical protein
MDFLVFCALDQMRFELPAVALKRERKFRQTGVSGRRSRDWGISAGLAPLVAQGGSALSIRGFELG